MTMHNGHEFEDRDSQLPADTRAVGAGVRPGVLDDVPLGTPDIDYDVRSVYDSRPVNGFDFSYSQSANAVLTGEDSANWTFVFTVPVGFVAVVRWYQWYSDLGALGIENYRGTLQRNGVNFPENRQVYLGPQSERMPQFVLVDEGQNFGVFVEGTSLQTSGAGLLTIHGNLLLKTGRAYPYEIANPVGVTRRSVLAPEQLRAPPVAPIPVQQPPPRAQPVPPSPAVQATASPAAPPRVPPFNLQWIKQTNFAVDRLTPTVRARAFRATAEMFWVPVVKQGRDNRALSESEASTYADYIDTHRPTIGNYR